MKRVITALAVGVAALAASAGTAFAGNPVQSTTQSSSTGQSATAASSATQVDPSNQNISVRILSPGDDGSVTQANGVSSSADASNTAATTQSADQTLSGACGCTVAPTTADALSGALAADPQAASAVGAAAPDTTPTGTSQSNGTSSDGTSANTAPTTQTASQSGSGVQSTDQNASTEQGANAASSAEQDHPSNTNVSVRILSPGDNGDVNQASGVSSTADAANTAATGQTSSQDSSGGGSGVQSAIQNAGTEQGANAASSAKQVDPSNTNVSVRILSPGDNGDVTQSNGVSSSANASNTASTTQSATQDPVGPSCPCGGSSPSVQAIGQSSWTGQNAYGASSATQVGASNTNYPVRIGSYGDDGNVTQSNGVSSSSTATNTAPVTQYADQSQGAPSCGCSGLAIQGIAQQSTVEQWGAALSSAQQYGASNTNDPVRIWSGGDGGDVTQSNGVSSSATTTNSAPVAQNASQSQNGSGIQAIGQKSGILQGAFAASSALQAWAPSTCGCHGSSGGNSSGPVRIGSYGDDGSLTQANGVSSSATAANTAAPTQSGTQEQLAPSCGCHGLSIQGIGQESWIGQLSKALSSASQYGASNSSDPVRLWSLGDGGDASQANGASSTASAPNSATTGQQGGQTMI
jgi:epidermal growth factor receptor substrate 15